MSSSSSPEPQRQAPTETQLHYEVFGAGSDVSDLSDSDDDRRPAKRLPFPARAAPPTERDQEDEDDDEGDDDDDRDAYKNDEDREEDVYMPGTVNAQAKIPKFKKSRKEKRAEKEEAAEGGEEGAESDDAGEARAKKKKKTKRREERRSRREVDDEEEAPVYDEATQRRMALEERIDNIGKKAKVARRKKKNDEDIVDSYHDDICARLRDRMMHAAEKDKASNEAKMPATAKLAMLDEVMSVLRNATLWQSIVDNGVLEAVRSWLEPMYPSGALPAVGIQSAIFEVLPKMDLDTTTLKESRLGPIVLFYTKTRRVTPAINRSADALVQAWSRPIIKRPANFRSKYVERDEDQNRDAAQTQSQRSQEGHAPGADGMVPSGTRKIKRFDINAALAENRGRKGARLPIIQEIQYTVAPESRTQHHIEDLQHVSRTQMDNRKYNKFARQMKGAKAR